jgi:hypothetical protein
MQVRTSRTFRAFLIAPLGSSIVLTCWGVWERAKFRFDGFHDLIVILAIFTFVSYVAALVVGIPAFFICRITGRMSCMEYTLAGTISGFVFSAGAFAASYGLIDTLADRKPEMFMGALAGAATGAVFWLVARMRAKNAIEAWEDESTSI